MKKFLVPALIISTLFSSGPVCAAIPTAVSQGQVKQVPVVNVRWGWRRPHIPVEGIKSRLIDYGTKVFNLTEEESEYYADATIALAYQFGLIETYEDGGSGGGAFVLILVLFILLVIIGAGFGYGGY